MTNLFILPYQEDLNFKRASNSVNDIKTCMSNRLNILKVINNDRLIFTVDSLKQMQTDLMDRTTIRYDIRPKVEKEKDRPNYESIQQR